MNNEIQNKFLERARKHGTAMTVFMVNGFQMHGVITAYDDAVVVFDSYGEQKVVYKHAISTMAPMQPVPLDNDFLR